MIDLGLHAVFIVTAYVGVFVVTSALIAAIVVDGWMKARKLAGLEAARAAEKPA